MDLSQFYMFHAIDDGSSVIVRRGDGAAKITAGGARWKSVTRPKRTSIILFDGTDAYELDVPVLLDGWAGSDSIEADIAKLNQMRFSHADLSRPSRIRIDGALPVKGATWIISSIEWGDNVIWHTEGDKVFRYRQDAVVHLIQYVPEATLTGIKPFKTNDKIITVKKGQTIKQVANGDHTKAKAIQKANNVRDVKSITANERLRVPRT